MCDQPARQRIVAGPMRHKFTALQKPKDAGKGYRFKAVATAEGAPTLTELYIYDEISWFGIMAQDVVNELMMVDTDEILVRLNSPGGDVFDGIAIKNALQTHPAKVNVSVDGLAASIASIIMLAGDTITMQPGSQVMIHQASGLAFGPAGTMRSLANLLDKQDANLAAMYAARVPDTTAAAWLELMNAETWFSDDEAVAAGLADAKGNAPVGQGQTARAAFDLSVFNFRFAGRDEAPAPVAPKVTNDRSAEVYFDWELGGGDPCPECEDLADNGPYPEDDLPDFDGYAGPHPNCQCDGFVPRLGWTGSASRTVTAADLAHHGWSCEACGRDFAEGDTAHAGIDTAELSAEWRCDACYEDGVPVRARYRNTRTPLGRLPGGRPLPAPANLAGAFDADAIRRAMKGITQ